MAIINGANLYYIDQGEGTPLIFIHPPVMSSACFVHQIQELSNYFRVIAFDIRGHGKSEPSELPLTYHLVAEDIKQLMDHLGIEQAVLCGYSTGGSIVLEFMLSHLERVTAAILIGGLSEVNDKRLKNQLRLASAIAKFGAMRFLAFVLCWGNSNSIRTFRYMYQDAKKSNSKNSAEYYDYSLIYNCTSRLGLINHPVLLVYGKKDTGFHHYADLIHKRIPTSELNYIQNVKHQIPTKAANELNVLIKQFVTVNCHER
ncbi:MAG: hydrolase [Bacilli bacterium]|nr:hydrolase [Bacilli bacterium]